MEGDVLLLLKENARLQEELIKVGKAFHDDIQVIPIILSHGTFSPKRLETWNYAKLARQDEKFLKRLSDGLITLATSHNSDSVSINEKKAVSFLVAASNSAPELVQSLLAETAIRAPRLHMLAREYVVPEKDWLNPISNLKLPCPDAEKLCPKFAKKYPLCTLFISNPSIHPIKELLRTDRFLEINFVVTLAARHFKDSRMLYNEILLPVWESKNTKLAEVVLKALSNNPDLQAFCLDRLRE